jgi:hypothetical protein
VDVHAEYKAARDETSLQSHCRRITSSEVYLAFTKLGNPSKVFEVVSPELLVGVWKRFLVVRNLL